jgi:hypothetical protein
MPFRSILVIASAILTGCASQPLGRSDLLAFLADGATPREDVLLKLGEPSASYEGSRILAYRLKKDEGGYILLAHGGPKRWYGVGYNLMLAFDSAGILRRHTIVEIRRP